MKLTEYLKRHNLTLTAFAERADVEVSTLSRAAAGKTVPSPKNMRRIMDASGGQVEPNDFFSSEAA